MLLEEEIFEKFEDIYIKYIINRNTSKNLNRLLGFYEDINTNWVNDYNKVNERKGKTKVKITTSGKKIDIFKAKEDVEETEYSKVKNTGRMVQIANSIGHTCEYIINKKLNGYIREHKNIQCDLDNNDQFKEISFNLRRIYRPITKEQEKQERKEYLMEKYSFHERDFICLEGYNFDRYMDIFNKCMQIKDVGIEKIHEILTEHKADTISYGYKEDDDGRALFVMDVPGFDQFSVHVKNMKLIDSLIKTPYNMPLYNRENVIILSRSKQENEIINDLMGNDSEDKRLGISEIANPDEKMRQRFVKKLKEKDMSKATKHRIAVLAGSPKEMLEEIER